MSVVLNEAGLTDASSRIKTLIDSKVAEGLCCGCGTKDQKYVNTLLMLRLGINLDIEFGEIEAANTKIDLLTKLLDGGKGSICGCK